MTRATASPSPATSSSATARSRPSSTRRNEIMSLATGRIEGNVTVGGVPVEGAEVAIIDPTPGQGPGLFPLTRNVVSHAVTDAAGNYALTVAPGTYNVVANLEGAPFEGEWHSADRALGRRDGVPDDHPGHRAADDGGARGDRRGRARGPAPRQGVGRRLRPEPRSAEHPERHWHRQPDDRRLQRPVDRRDPLRHRAGLLHRPDRRLGPGPRSSQATTRSSCRAASSTRSTARTSRSSPGPPRR